jgi:ankyrin repeat protein
VVKLLLEERADVESKDTKYGQTPLSWAAENRHETVVKLPLEKRADVESKDIGSWTPLVWAAANGHKGVVKLLLEKRADMESKDTKYGWRGYPSATPAANLWTASNMFPVFKVVHACKRVWRETFILFTVCL